MQLEASDPLDGVIRFRAHAAARGLSTRFPCRRFDTRWTRSTSLADYLQPRVSAAVAAYLLSLCCLSAAYLLPICCLSAVSLLPCVSAVSLLYLCCPVYLLPLCLQSVYVAPSASPCATDGSVWASCISCFSSEIFPLRLCTVQGHKFPCPRVTGLYLYRRYGPTWHQAVEDNDTDQSIDPASAVSLRAKVSCMVQSLVCKLLMWQAVALVPNIPNLHAVPPCVMYPWGSWSGCHIESSSECLSKRTRRLVSHIHSN